VKVQNSTEETVRLTIDGQSVEVAKGTTVLEAAKTAGIDIPHYCYHPFLSIPGNCRMCQVEVEGAPKLMISCHTVATDEMVVRTHRSSQVVRDAQEATLSFLLANHPLDCTVCDQSGHCLLQDYRFEYNAKSSRFIEEKVKKVKAKVLGPTVVLDAERCIACTRCIRFCDEITKTSELGMLNRGDRVEITVKEGRELDNPLSGTVVDLCPVGALTHRKWRFLSRIWFSRQADSVCPGCSTGCNVKVASRDSRVVAVKARLNSEVNREWLCDEGRYGFDRFLPEERILHPMVDGVEVDWAEAFKRSGKLRNRKTLVLLSPELMVEEYALLDLFLKIFLKEYDLALAYKERNLNDLEKILISPDCAPNFQGAKYLGLELGQTDDGSGGLENRYKELLSALKSAKYNNLLVIGDHALCQQDLEDKDVLAAVDKLDISVALLCDLRSPLTGSSKVVFPARSIVEKSGLLVNRNMRLQFSGASVDFPAGTEADWRILNRLAEAFGNKVVSAHTDRDLSIWCLMHNEKLKGLRLSDIRGQGVCLNEWEAESRA